MYVCMYVCMTDRQTDNFIRRWKSQRLENKIKLINTDNNDNSTNSRETLSKDNNISAIKRATYR